MFDRQFTAMRRMARTATPPWREQVIERHGAAVGWLATTQDPEGVELLRIDVLPGQQASGIGSAALDALLRAADADGLTVRTRVLVTNARARAWYARRGFTETDGDEVTLRLERRPDTGSGTS